MVVYTVPCFYAEWHFCAIDNTDSENHRVVWVGRDF